MEQIYASLEVISRNFGNTSGASFAIILGLGLIAGALISTLGSRVTRLAAMDTKAKEQVNFGYLSPLGKCWSCDNTLPFWQQIPILSFAFLRRKCYYCSSEISWRYPITETLIACLLLICLLRWSELKVGFGYFVFFSGIVLALSILLRGIILPNRVTFVLCILGLLASALDFGQLSPKDAILGTALGYIIPFTYNTVNSSINPHLESVREEYLLFFASIGSWLGPMIAVEILLAIVAIKLIFRAIGKPHPLTFEYQIALVGFFAIMRTLLR